jgi:hypothetical protein
MMYPLRLLTLRSIFNLMVRANCCAPCGSVVPSETSATAGVDAFTPTTMGTIIIAARRVNAM